MNSSNLYKGQIWNNNTQFPAVSDPHKLKVNVLDEEFAQGSTNWYVVKIK